jgi:hypothetical protein
LIYGPDFPYIVLRFLYYYEGGKGLTTACQKQNGMFSSLPIRCPNKQPQNIQDSDKKVT